MGPRVIHIIHNLELFTTSKALSLVLTKTIPYIQMFPNEIHIVKVKIKIVEVS